MEQALREQANGDSCSICFDHVPLENEVTMLLTCSHYFHTLCLQKWFKTDESTMRCPLCRTSVTTKGLVTTSVDHAKEYGKKCQEDRKKMMREKTEVQPMTKEQALEFFDYANRRVFRNVLNRPGAIIFCNRAKSSNIIHTVRENPQESILKYQVPNVAQVMDKKKKIFELMRWHYDMYFRENDEYKHGIDRLCEIFLRPTLQN